MIRRRHGYLHIRQEPAPDASTLLEREGHAVVEAVLSAAEVRALSEEIASVFDRSEPDRGSDVRDEFRHAMLNRSPLSQRAIASPALLEVIEPLLGEDCHVIANTAWRNIAGHRGGPWHTDAGPHVPRPEGVAWPDEIPYPVFAIGVHIFLEDCPLDAGPTAVLAGSHRSGRPVPAGGAEDAALSYDGRPPVMLTASAGDAALFVSDAWHRGTPAKPGFRRFFLQAHYGRRDIAQRILRTEDANHLTPQAVEWADTERERRLFGLHPARFYDG